MNNNILICSDLDRTILPNGKQEESPLARPLLSKLAQLPEIILAYVSGRDIGLIQKAIEEYDIPTPHFAIGDVGTTLYEIKDHQWLVRSDWKDEIASDWKGMEHSDIYQLVNDLPSIHLQEEEKQNQYKVSFYAATDTVRHAIVNEIEKRLKNKAIQASIIWSVDETKDTALIDILPEGATKLHAVQFLRKSLQIPVSHTMFAGDSGNDMQALTGGLQAVLVNNASDEVKQEARDIMSQSENPEKLYFAQGNFLGMNGCYSAGVIEGIAHFFPHLKEWMNNQANQYSLK